MRHVACAVILLTVGCAIALSGGATAAGEAEVKGMLDEIRLVPPARRALAGEDVAPPAKLPAFSPQLLAAYKPDGYKAIADLMKRQKADREAFAKAQPVRAVVLDAIEAMRANDKLVIRESLKSPVNQKVKLAMLQSQTEVARALFALEQALDEMRRVGERDLAKESSKRWQANFQFVEARLLARIVFLYEYSYHFGQVRADALPPLPEGVDGWVLIPRERIQVTEPKAKNYAKQAAKALGEIQKQHPSTPWAFFAQRDSQLPLGLEWQAAKKP
jgi:hypothetical protein